MKPRDLSAKTELKKNNISRCEDVTSRGYTLLNVDRSRDVLIWEAVGRAGKQMHYCISQDA